MAIEVDREPSSAMTKRDWREAWALFPGNIAYVWHAVHADATTVDNSLFAAGF